MPAREERFRRLFSDAYAPVVAYARRRVDAADVDDIVAEVFTVAWRRLDAVPDDDCALPWLYAVAYRAIANLRRSERRRAGLAARLALVRSDPAPAPQAEGDTEILAALARLRPGDQEILRLSAWEDLAPAQIAAVLGCSVNAATIRLSRARERLRQELKGSAPRRTLPRRKEIDARPR